MTDKTFSGGSRPSVAVTTAVLTVHERTLCVALVSHRGRWALPGTLVRAGETLADAVRRSLEDKAGIQGLVPQQLHVFDLPAREGRDWSMSVAHTVTAPAETLAGVALEPVAEAHGLPSDHDEIIELATTRLRTHYAAHPDPAQLLGHEFTLFELQQLHEAASGCPLMRDTFRRAMEPQLFSTGTTRRGGVGKPARLFQRTVDR